MTDPKGESESGQLSESARSRTREKSERESTHETLRGADEQDENPGKHGRPTDDSDPGHS
ncbi:hypothetical protein [Deinococcus sp. YIM 77859]|uniref:hypothetical protein n=1 Tax=Deinococcus sp. YIM 77859 TaxID=1540221 RepID=UPI0005569F05|nr:hypothetical protein [Deinococcus sp. YIM 77859]